MTTGQELKTYLEASFPNYKIIDGSNLKPTRESLGVSINSLRSKPNVLMFLVRSKDNVRLYQTQDLFFQEDQGRPKNLIITGKMPDIWLYHTDDYLAMSGTCEEVAKRLQIWLVDETRTTCFICYEVIKDTGACCQVCGKCPCNTCWLEMYRAGKMDCPLCRTAKTLCRPIKS